MAAAPSPRRPQAPPQRRLLGTRRTRIGLLNATPIVVYLLVLFVFPILSTLLLSLKAATAR